MERRYIQLEKQLFFQTRFRLLFFIKPNDSKKNFRPSEQEGLKSDEIKLISRER